jgi:hypothetical protein
VVGEGKDEGKTKKERREGEEIIPSYVIIHRLGHEANAASQSIYFTLYGAGNTSRTHISCLDCQC